MRANSSAVVRVPARTAVLRSLGGSLPAIHGSGSPDTRRRTSFRYRAHPSRPAAGTESATHTRTIDRPTDARHDPDSATPLPQPPAVGGMDTRNSRPTAASGGEIRNHHRGSLRPTRKPAQPGRRHTSAEFVSRDRGCRKHTVVCRHEFWPHPGAILCVPFGCRVELRQGCAHWWNCASRSPGAFDSMAWESVVGTAGFGSPAVPRLLLVRRRTAETVPDVVDPETVPDAVDPVDPDLHQVARRRRYVASPTVPRRSRPTPRREGFS